MAHVLARDEGGGLVGYAGVDLRPSAAPTGAELVVAPGARRRGFGGGLLHAVRALTAQAGLDAPAVWAHGDLPAARALASGAGMSVVRELWRMERELDEPVVAGDPPDGVRVRPFVVGQDEEAWLQVNGRAFADHPEQGRMGPADLRAREREPWFDAEDLLLAEDADGTLLASLWMKVEPGSGAGELYALGVDPAAQGRGLGRYLTARTSEHLGARGCPRVVLYVEADNFAAVRTYTAAGFRTARSDVQYR